MRYLLPMLLALAACSSDPAPPVDSGPLDTGPADTGSDAPITHDWLFIDAGEDRPALVDVGSDAGALDAGADVGADTGIGSDTADCATDVVSCRCPDGTESSHDVCLTEWCNCFGHEGAPDAGADAAMDVPADRSDVVVADASDAAFCADGGLMCRAQCVDYRRDPDNCGACGARCLRPGSPFTGTTGATTGCENGMCANVVCVAGRANCDGDGANGCETDLQTPANCGSCGRRCRSCDLGFCIP